MGLADVDMDVTQARVGPGRKRQSWSLKQVSRSEDTEVSLLPVATRERRFTRKPAAAPVQREIKFN